MRSMLLTLVVGALIATLSFTAGQRMALKAQTPNLSDLHNLAWLMDQHDLTPSQLEALLALEHVYHQQLMDLCGYHCAARKKLADLFFCPSWTQEKEQELLEIMGRTQVATAAATLLHLRNIGQTLSSSAREQFEQKVVACLQGVCPHHLHHSSFTKMQITQ